MKYFYLDTRSYYPKAIVKLAKDIKKLRPELDVSDVTYNSMHWNYVGIGRGGKLTKSDSGSNFHKEAILITELSQISKSQEVFTPIKYKKDIESFEKLKDLTLTTLVAILDARTLDEVIAYLREEL